MLHSFTFQKAAAKPYSSRKRHYLRIMSDHVTPDMERLVTSLHRDEEEDLIDYGDSEAEAEASSNQEADTAVAIEEIDIFADDATHAEEPEEESTETAAPPTAPPVSASRPTTTKTTEAAIMIKNLNKLLTDANFRAALGLVEAGNDINVNFWADGLDFALSLKLVGVAEVKACRFGANCRNKDCTFDHGGADRTAITSGKKPQKLCNKINTPAGCPRGDACWFSHELIGVACADSDLRATRVKGTYCLYKHNDDEVVASVEHVEQNQEGAVVKGGEIDEAEASTQGAPVDPTPPAKPENALPAPAAGTTASPKQQARGVKRGREPEDEVKGRPQKAQRVEQRQNRQETTARRGRGGSSAPQRAESENPDRGRRGSGDHIRGRRGERGGRDGAQGDRSDSYRPSEERQRGGRKQGKKVPLSERVTRS